ncbi:MAG: 30S ribosomal protein S20 [Candidatus Omnitrophota bacterium]
MPQRKCALKAMRSSKKKRVNNLKIKNNIKKLIKNFIKLISTKKLEEAKKLLPSIASSLDKAAKKKIIHINSAKRKISRLALKLKST